MTTPSPQRRSRSRRVVETAAELDEDLGSVAVVAFVDDAMLTIGPLGTDSRFDLGIALGTDGDIGARVAEVWAIDEHITRTCDRGSIGDVPGDCFDTDDRDDSANE